MDDKEATVFLLGCVTGLLIFVALIAVRVLLVWLLWNTIVPEITKDAVTNISLLQSLLLILLFDATLNRGTK